MSDTDPLRQISDSLSSLVHSLIQSQVEDAHLAMDIRHKSGLEEHKLRDYAKEIDVSEVGRRCPFCDMDFSEHEDTARHMATAHTLKTAKRYATRINWLYEHPNEVSGRYEWVLTGVSDKSVDNYFCPFCEERIPTFRSSDLRKHVTKAHSVFMKVFTSVILGGGK